LGKAETPIEFLIHNAAVIHENARLWEIDPGQLDKVIDVNIKGTFNVLQAFLPCMLKRRRGIIITLSSGAGSMGLPEISGYCATKWAVEGLTKSLAKELPDGMTAIPMSPGIIDTDMLRSNFGDEAGNFKGPTEWAKVAVPFILGLDSSRSGESATVPEPR
jgi:NAD(P)-dependent dehydrogenase (short-subunit alcohol dehydrogenase family)